MIVIYERKCSAVDNNAMRIDLDGRAVEVYNDVLLPAWPGQFRFRAPAQQRDVDLKINTDSWNIGNLLRNFVYEMFANKSFIFIFCLASFFSSCCTSPVGLQW